MSRWPSPSVITPAGIKRSSGLPTARNDHSVGRESELPRADRARRSPGRAACVCPGNSLLLRRNRKISAGILRSPSQALGQEARCAGEWGFALGTESAGAAGLLRRVSQDTRSARPESSGGRGAELEVKGRRAAGGNLAGILEDRFAGNSSAGRPPAGTSVSQPLRRFFFAGRASALCGLRHRCNAAAHAGDDGVPLSAL